MNYVLEINWKYFCWKRILRFQRISQKNCKVSGLEKIEERNAQAFFEILSKRPQFFNMNACDRVTIK